MSFISETVCFYEYPAASHDIEKWKLSIEPQLVLYKSFSDNVHVFLLNKQNSNISSPAKYEIVICTPIKLLDDVGVNKTSLMMESSIENIISIESFLNGLELKYNKCLIFGKVEVNQLKNIIIFINDRIQRNMGKTI